MMKPYFKSEAGAPPPLRITVEQRVRFEECDPLGIVWHGRYASYFEDARVALGDRFGIGYMDFHNRGVDTPLKQMFHEYILPLRFHDKFTIEGILHWSEAARLNMEFILRNSAGEITTRGYTIQLMLDPQFQLLLNQPDFYLAFCERWRRGELS